MKWIFTLLIIAFNLFSTIAQSTYNYRLSFDLPGPSVFGSVEVTDSCFYMSGVTVDTVFPYYVSGLFSKLSLEGEILFAKILSSPERSYETWANTLEPTVDGNFILPGTSIDSIGRSTVLVKYTPNGDTLFTKHYRSPYFPSESFIAAICSQLSPDGGAYVLSNISNSGTDIYIKKVNSFGQLEWGKIYGESQVSESASSILLSDQKILIGGRIDNLNFSPQNHFSRGLLIQINASDGTVEWEYETPVDELRYSISDIIRTDDDGYLLSSGKGVVLGPPSASYVSWQPFIFKLDANRNYEWGVDIRDSFYQTTNIINKIVGVADGYVIAGRSYRPNPSENGYDMLGLIAKISKEGDSLWTRRYNYVQSRSDDHIFYDLEKTPDGGFVMVGEAADYFNLQSEPPIQRAWIVKVDQHGCLVPGCHLISPTVELQEANFEIKIYPNPATDYLNVYFQHPRLRGTAYFSLVDAKGKVVLEFQSRHEDITHMIPVIGLATGTYWLRCQVGTEVLTKEVLVQ
ncbi:MAG: hypothetical protein ACI9XB_002688 [Gammaproteobacteria bacterium]|jgi:hypothetical protein